MSKKIRIEHASNPLNYGTSMMVINFMYYLDKYSQYKNQYVLDVYNDKDLHNFSNQYKEGNIKRETIDYSLTYSNNIIEKIINKIKRKVSFNYFYNRKVEKLKNNTDKLVILGGDDLSEYYGVEGLKRELSRIENIKDQIKVFLIGQTIGPFYDERIELAKQSLKNIPIYSRDPWTTKYLKDDLGLIDNKESADLALLPLPYQENKKIEKGILEKYKLTTDDYITIVPSGLYKSYCNDKKIYIDNWIDIVKGLKNKFPEKKLVFLPHVLRYSQYDDRNIIKELEKELKEDHIYIYDEMMPLEARFILGNGLFTVTGRMHGAISTLQMGKPAISISYSEKYNGVIGEGLKLKDTIVHGKTIDKWTNFTVSKEVLKTVDIVCDDMEKFKDRIVKSVSEAKLSVEEMIKKISREI
ncbi:polysaccharide pyruvyl transferase family protein [Clostridium botulinum]|uniref:polysaccharide pyruvyl transferase family protein n=1 Tax=Clostridium botulinum TaxID=1491 RepID=UPI0013F00ED3|nr:polysaccharide pyruvyl transferase family protein [Clostridium botulinum]MBY6917961.1 polysaccharide pyruvyl transferase family protein [Clostridium botulinum]NFL35840.1 polysaccharide pyruvyl transferase family protein [Clostridium botulinum]NFM05036.1 polysaccharide pyruvyl transferase family protein [Clostridium botulinum]NFO40973.1 polysaccharide pyruvyl transferase family protein [Clostridium botulinum]NFQ39715.1 polysaccharide pyruvyl transferase family protein [Clostridium botulinum]